MSRIRNFSIWQRQTKQLKARVKHMCDSDMGWRNWCRRNGVCPECSKNLAECVCPKED